MSRQRRKKPRPVSKPAAVPATGTLPPDLWPQTILEAAYNPGYAYGRYLTPAPLVVLEIIRYNQGWGQRGQVPASGDLDRAYSEILDTACRNKPLFRERRLPPVRGKETWLLAMQADIRLVAAGQSRATIAGTFVPAGDPGYEQIRGLTTLALWALEDRYTAAAGELYRAALARTPPGDEGLRLVVVQNLGLVARLSDQPDQAAAYYREALLLTQQRGDRRTQGGLLYELGSVAQEQGFLDTAQAYYDAGLRLAQERGFPEIITQITFGLATLAHRRGQGERAERLYHEALAGFEAGGLAGSGAAITRQTLGHLLHEQGRTAAARALYQQSLAYYVHADPNKEQELRTALAELAAGQPPSAQLSGAHRPVVEDSHDL